VEQRISPRAHRMALWVGGPVMSVVYMFGWLAYARLMPVPSPSWSAERLSEWLVDRQPEFQIGCLIMIAAAGTWGLWCAAMSVWTYRTEQRFPVLFAGQVISVGCGLTIFVLDELFWTVASFRAGETDPAVTQAIWDIGWFGFLFSITAYISWAVCFALGILWNPPEHQMFPRWAGYMTLASCLCWSLGLMIVFFKSGPFSYNGTLAMWLPLAEFFVWLIFMTYLGLKAISKQEVLCRQEAEQYGAGYGVYYPGDDERALDEEDRLRAAIPDEVPIPATSGASRQAD